MTMLGSFEMWVGSRYVRSRSSNQFVSLISAISMGGIAVAVAVLIVVLSVVNGFERELKDRLLAMTSHANIIDSRHNYTNWPEIIDLAESNERVNAAAPYIDGQGLLVYGERLSGVKIQGVEPALEKRVSGIGDVLVDGTLESLAEGEFNIVLGIELANELRVKLGDKVTLTLAEGVVTPAGVIPRTRRFTVSGIYRVGMFEFDRRLAFVHLGDAQKLFRLRGLVSGIRLSVTDVYSASEIVREVATDIGMAVSISDWTRRHVNFFKSIQITKSILFVILLMVVAVAAFNIVSTLVMVVKDKQSDIAILRTTGASPSMILGIFITQGSIVGVVGTALGVLFGLLIASNLESIVGFVEGVFSIKLRAADVYFISDLPSEIKTGDVVKISVIALLLALASTFYPAWRASRTLPAEALRYD